MASKNDSDKAEKPTKDGLRETLADILDNLPNDSHPQVRDHINAALDLSGGRPREDRK